MQVDDRPVYKISVLPWRGANFLQPFCLSRVSYLVAIEGTPGRVPWDPERMGVLPHEEYMKITRLCTPLIAAALMTSPVLSLAQNAQTNKPTQDWNAAPAGTEQAQNQGFRDGIEAAKLDKAAKRTIDAKTSHLYKKPPVKKEQQDAYRSDFEKGYQTQVEKDNTGGL